MRSVFIDTSVLFAAAYSETGSARDLIRLATEQRVTAFVSQQVLLETIRNVSKKIPERITDYESLLRSINPSIVPDASWSILLK